MPRPSAVDPEDAHDHESPNSTDSPEFTTKLHTGSSSYRGPELNARVFGEVSLGLAKRDRSDPVGRFEEGPSPVLAYPPKSPPSSPHARLTSILRKAEPGAMEKADYACLGDSSALLLNMGRLPSVFQRAAENAEPSDVTQYILALAREVNSWIAANRVLGQAAPTTAARLQVVEAARQTINIGLTFIGVGAPDSI